VARPSEGTDRDLISSGKRPASRRPFLFEAGLALLTAAAIGKLSVDGSNTVLEIIARSSYVPALPSSALFPEFRRCTP
jgi:hypothetical protein